jgi:small conductance mechanosensitive channel
VFLLCLVIFAHLVPALRAAGTALLASASVVGLVLGIAAQNTLGNLIAGVSIGLYRPFHIGDWLQVSVPGGVASGRVETLSLGRTVLRTEDNRRVVVPNSVMLNATTINLNAVVANQGDPPA